jgi:ABC-type Fe3+/spermidine/putrescine transport system ATPase subunit
VSALARFGAQLPVSAAPEPEPLVVLDGVTKSFGDVTAADAISLTVQRRQFVCLLGPSGCGKTTLLRMIAGLEAPSAGRIYLAGRDVTGVPPQHRDIGFVFQRYALFPHMSVRDNVAFGLRVRGQGSAERGARADEMLDLVQLEHLAGRLPSEISGGQAQRVALARALAPSPEVLLLDEPLSALDLSIRVAMQEELRRIHRELGTTFVFVTHDQVEALTMSDRVLLMDDGAIAQDSSPSELYRRPQSLFAATFVGDANVWSGVVEGAPDGERCGVRLDGGLVSGRPAAGLAAGQDVAYVIRPELVTLVAAGETAAGPDDCRVDVTVGDVIVRGSTALVIASTAGGTSVRIQVPINDAGRFERGQSAAASWSFDDAFVFPPRNPRSKP